MEHHIMNSNIKQTTISSHQYLGAVRRIISLICQADTLRILRKLGHFK